LPTLTEAENQELLINWNNTSIDFQTDKCLHELFEARVSRSPEAVVVKHEDNELTNNYLNERANQLAHYLIALGVRPNKLVGICMKRSPDMLVAMLGILKAGGAYVPLDPDFPSERLSFMLKDTGVSVVLGSTSTKTSLPDNNARLFCIDSDWDIVSRESTDNPDTDVIPENLAYIMYTSGSTGKPKGVMVPHRAINNHMLWMQHTFPLSDSDSVIQKTPYSFDASVWEIYAPLITDATLVIARNGGHKDCKYLTDLIISNQITAVKLAPSLLRMLVEEPQLNECTCIKHVFCGSEVLPQELVKRFYNILPKSHLHNMYGPTETAVDVTWWSCDLEEEGSVPIGKAVANTQIYILNDNLDPVAVGESGELHIGGIQVACGYLNRPELTKRKFITDPFSKNQDALLYKSGDIARYRSDGSIEYLGRIDHQIKINGIRIEAGEIESTLESHPSVKQVVVVIKKNISDQRLVAYVVLKKGMPSQVKILRKYLEEKLPDYMVPNLFLILDELPLTSSGKIDRAALPEPDNKRPTIDTAYVSPHNKLEQHLASIWCELLNIDRVGINDKFFELGGTSILAAQFISRIREELGENIYIVSIFESPSIAEYIKFLKREYPAAVAEKYGIGQAEKKSACEELSQAMISEMHECVPAYIKDHKYNKNVRGNPQAIFVLAPPRSGTTLLRVMLAGHPGFFAAAELNLLMFNSMDERKAAFKDKFSLWLEGNIRAVMDIKDCDADEAKRIIEKYEKEGSTTQAFYQELQEWIGNRILIDKTPAYALDYNALEKAERDFNNALYIHLTRHPYAMTRSFEKKHLDQVLFLNKHNFSSRQLAELVWLVSHQNTSKFLQQIPDNRKFRIKFEDMVKQPQEIMEAMCQNFGFDYHSDLIDPYKNIDKKMTDGIYDVSAPMGDTRLLERNAIDPAVADSWKGVLSDNYLSDITWDVAEEFGYERPVQTGKIVTDQVNRKNAARTRRDKMAQQRQVRSKRR